VETLIREEGREGERWEKEKKERGRGEGVTYIQITFEITLTVCLRMLK
jgi:hypothetical protein